MIIMYAVVLPLDGYSIIGWLKLKNMKEDLDYAILGHAGRVAIYT